MKFIISNKNKLERKFSNWYYSVDDRCGICRKNGKLYIYSGYIIDKVKNIEDYIDSSTIKSGLNGNYFVVELDQDRACVMVDHFSQHKIFYRKRKDLVEISNRIFLFSLSNNDLDKKELLDRNRELADRPTRDARTKSMFKDIYILSGYHKLQIIGTEVKMIKTHDPAKKMYDSLFGDGGGRAMDQSALDDFIYNCMSEHSAVLKEKYTNIVSSVSEGIDSVLQDSFFPKYQKITYNFDPPTVDASIKIKYFTKANYGQLQTHTFQLSSQSAIAHSMANDTENTHPDCLPTIWQMKTFFPQSDLLLYGQFGDQVFLHDPYLQYMYILGCIIDDDRLNEEQKFEQYRRKTAELEQSYSSRTAISADLYPSENSLFQNEDYSAFKKTVRHLKNTWKLDLVNHMIPLSNAYSRDLIHACDVPVASLYADMRFFYLIHNATSDIILKNMSELTTQKNILKKKFGMDFQTPFKDPAIFHMREMIGAWKTSAVSYCLEEHVIDGKININNSIM